MTETHRTKCQCAIQNPQVNRIYHHMAEANAPLAMAYVPYQYWEQPLPLCAGLKTGTVFSSLNQPFCGKGGKYS